MAQTIRVLIIEDTEMWQNHYEDALGIEQGRCVAHVVTSMEAAIDLLHHEVFHVAIVDLNLKNANNPQAEDTVLDGLKIIEKMREYGWLDKMVVFVVSFVSEISQMLNLRPILADKMRHELPKGAKVNDVIYFSKADFEPMIFWETLKRELKSKKLYTEIELEQSEIIKVLAQRMTRNLIDHLESRSAHSSLAPEDEWLRDLYAGSGEDALYARMVMEIEELIRRWAGEVGAQDVHLEQIGNGLSKAAVVKAMRKIKIGGAERWQNAVIIKFGYHREISRERDAFNLLAGFLRRAPNSQNGARVVLLDSQIYEFFHSDSFANAYHKKPIEYLEALLEEIFEHNCAVWYSSNGEGIANAQYYMNYLNCQLKRLEKPILQLESEAVSQGHDFFEKQFLNFPSIQESYFNPLYLLHDEAKLSNLREPAKISITHGDFNANNILIGANDETCLIDFARTEESHALRDFIQLEAVVKFFLLKNASLAERHALEKALLQQDSFGDIQHLRHAYHPSTANAYDLEKAFRLVCKIRELAFKVVLNNQGNSPLASFRQYYIGLFFLSLNSVRFIRTAEIPDGIEPIQALHALLAAAMLAQRLGNHHDLART